MASGERASAARSRRAVLPLAGLVALCGTAGRSEDAPTLVHRQRYSMGTMVDVLVYHPRPDDARRAAEAALAEILRLEQVMSHYRADSDLSALMRNAGSGLTRTHPDLYDVISQALEMSSRSSGAFDITIGPLLRVWTRARDEGRTPDAAEIDAARRCVGYDGIELARPDLVGLRSACMELDLGGIGKGYAVDRALAVLKSRGIRHALVNAGGSSIAAIGHPPGQRGWPVALDLGQPAAVLLTDGAISTSQQAVRSTRAGPAGDIIDPRTGAPAGYPGRVSVTAASATLSDALSTTLILLPPEAAVLLLEGFDGVSAMWFAADGRQEAAYRDHLVQFSTTGPR
jgi:thiamine biosynthesis lipoprotein